MIRFICKYCGGVNDHQYKGSCPKCRGYEATEKIYLYKSVHGKDIEDLKNLLSKANEILERIMP